MDCATGLFESDFVDLLSDYVSRLPLCERDDLGDAPGCETLTVGNRLCPRVRQVLQPLRPATTQRVHLEGRPPVPRLPLLFLLCARDG